MIDDAKLLSNEQVRQLVPLKIPDESGIDGLSDEEKQKVAKDFESLLIAELLDEMKNSIGSWGFEKDGASEQVHGLFWMYLARDVADNGGLGLWRDIYQMLTAGERSGSAGHLLDDNL